VIQFFLFALFLTSAPSFAQTPLEECHAWQKRFTQKNSVNECQLKSAGAVDSPMGLQVHNCKINNSKDLIASRITLRYVNKTCRISIDLVKKATGDSAGSWNQIIGVKFRSDEINNRKDGHQISFTAQDLNLQCRSVQDEWKCRWRTAPQSTQNLRLSEKDIASLLEQKIVLASLRQKK
jgi:hypothetical protein